MLQKKPYPVEAILTHHATHEDELNARAQGRRFGRKAFVGIQTAGTVLVDAGLYDHEGDRWLKERRQLCIGVHGGILDEHGSDGTRKGSAAVCMAEWLGIDSDQAIAAMLSYSLRADGKSVCTPFEWGALVKAWWEAKMEFPTVAALYDTSFDGMYHVLSGRPAVATPSITFRRLIAEWISAKFGDSSLPRTVKSGVDAVAYYNQADNRALRQIVELDRCEQVVHTFGLHAIWVAIIAAGTSEQTARDFVWMTLDAKYDIEGRYLTALQEFPDRVKYIPQVPYRVGVVISDNSQMLRAARRSVPDMDVFVQVRSNGTVGIFSTRGIVDLSPVAGVLRDLEGHVRGDRPVPYQERLKPGTLHARPEWYNWVEGNVSLGVFNGTPTAPNRPTTALKINQLIRGIRAGLSSSLAQIS